MNAAIQISSNNLKHALVEKRLTNRILRKLSIISNYAIVGFYTFSLRRLVFCISF